MKNTLFFITVILLFASCTTWTRVGNVTMISTRNIDSKMDYVEIARYVDSESRNVKKALKDIDINTGEKFNIAIDKCVASVPGGEFMKNVQIYVNQGTVKVIGDVWGKGTASAVNSAIGNNSTFFYNKFKVGDTVSWDYNGIELTGHITGKEPETATVNYKDYSGKERIFKIEYPLLFKIEK